MSWKNYSFGGQDLPKPALNGTHLKATKGSKRWYTGSPITDIPVVVNAEEAGDEDAEDEEDDAGSGDDDHRPRCADHITHFKISLNKNWGKTVF